MSYVCNIRFILKIVISSSPRLKLFVKINVYTDCAPNTFGHNCTSVCNCIANNTMAPEQSCDQDSGKCRCSPNWEGERCDDDVDECEQELHNCDVNKEMCRNFPGGFECTVIEAVVFDQTNGMYAMYTTFKT